MCIDNRCPEALWTWLLTWYRFVCHLLYIFSATFPPELQRVAWQSWRGGQCGGRWSIRSGGRHSLGHCNELAQLCWSRDDWVHASGWVTISISIISFIIATNCIPFVHLQPACWHVTIADGSARSSDRKAHVASTRGRSVERQRTKRRRVAFYSNVQ